MHLTITAKRIDGRTVHTVGLPYHWAGIGRVRGDVVNELVSFVADPNVNIQESKALTCAVVPGRRARGRRAATVEPPIAVGEAAGGRGDERDRPGVGQKTKHPPEHKEQK